MSVPLFRAALGLFPLCALLALPGCRSGRFPEYPANYREYAYVADSGSGTVSVLDLVHLRREAVLSVPPHPVALAAGKTRNQVYVASQGAPGARGTVSTIDAETNRVVARLPVGKSPTALAIDSAGDRLYVANGGSNNVSIVDLRREVMLGAVGAGEAPDAIAVSPDGRTLAVANARSGSVLLFALAPGALPRFRASFSGCPGAGSLAILPDSSKVFAACSAGHQVMALELQQGDRRAANIEGNDQLLALLDVGEHPARLVMKPDGGELFVANEGSDSVSEISTGTNEVGGAALIGAHPAYGVVSADNALLWIANEAADTVAVYSIDDGKLVNTVHVGAGPGPLVFSADGHLLLAADTRAGDVSVLRTFDRNLHREPVLGTLFTLLPAGSGPAAIVDKAFRLPR